MTVLTAQRPPLRPLVPGAVGQDVGHGASVQRRHPRGHHRGNLRSPLRVPGKDCANPLLLVRLHVEEEHVGAVRPPFQRQCPDQVALQLDDHPDDQDPEAERERDGDGLVAGTKEIRDPLPEGVAGPARKEPACPPREAECHTQQDRGHDGEAPCKREARFRRRRLEEGEGENRDGDGGHRQDPCGILPRRGLRLQAQRLQRRHLAHLQERQQREYEGHPRAQKEAEGDGPGRHGRRHLDRQHVTDEKRQEALHDQTQSHSARRSQKPHPHRLQQVDREYLPPCGADAAQDGDRREVGAHEDVHGTPHADPAEQQGSQSDQAQKVGEKVGGPCE